MSQSLVKRIVTMEQEAEHLYTEAQKQAEDILKEAREAAKALKERTLSEAQQQAEQIIADGQAEAKAEHAAIIQQAEAEAQQMEQTATQNFDRAVEYVLNEVAGGTTTSASPSASPETAPTQGKD